MQCPYCKNEIPKKIFYCPKCGQQIEQFENEDIKKYWDNYKEKVGTSFAIEDDIQKNIISKSKQKIIGILGVLIVVIIIGVTVKNYNSESSIEDVGTYNDEVEKENNENNEGDELSVSERNDDSSDLEIQNTNEYILPESNTKYLTKFELQGLTKEECRLARNEIYARHGRIFNDESLQEYFQSLSWYSPMIQPEDFDENTLNEYEIANRDLIVEYEIEQGYR